MIVNTNINKEFIYTPRFNKSNIKSVNQKRYFSYSTYLFNNLTSQKTFSENETKKGLNYKVENWSKTIKSQDLSNFPFSELVFTGLVNILRSNPINLDTQIKLERFVRNQFTDFLQNKSIPIVLGINSEIINSKFNDYIFNKSDDLSLLLKKRKRILNSKQFKSDIKTSI